MKLYLLLLGAEAPGRVVEQRDYFFGIADNPSGLLPEARAFWPDAGHSLHIDGWREVNKVDDCTVRVVPLADDGPASGNKLFFLNLGGCTCGKLEEQHYTVLTIQNSRLAAMQFAKKSLFFKTKSLKGIASAHIDKKYGIDMDSVHYIEDLLSPAPKAQYRIVFCNGTGIPDDKIHLGYFKLDKLK
jgi:hypothetical protein